MSIIIQLPNIPNTGRKMTPPSIPAMQPPRRSKKESIPLVSPMFVCLSKYSLQAIGNSIPTSAPEINEKNKSIEYGQ